MGNGQLYSATNRAKINIFVLHLIKIISQKSNLKCETNCKYIFSVFAILYLFFMYPDLKMRIATLNLKCCLDLDDGDILESKEQLLLLDDSDLSLDLSPDQVGVVSLKSPDFLVSHWQNFVTWF